MLTMKMTQERAFPLRRVLPLLFLGGACVVGFGVQGFADSKDLAVEMKVWKVVTKDGETSRVPAEKVKVGDVLKYEVVYRNNSSRTLKNIQAQLPIPAAMEYVPGSANPAQVQASVDGKQFASIPLRRREVVDGKSKVVNVPTSEYRYLRWNIATLNAGKSVTVSARTQLKK